MRETLHKIKPHFIPVVILTTILFLFKKDYLFILLKNKWIDPIASHMREEPIALCGIIILSICFISWIQIHNKTSKVTIISYGFLSVIIIFTRTSHFWKYEQNILLIFMLAVIISFLISLDKWVFKHDGKPPIDIPDDQFQRRGFSKNLLENLISKRNIEESFNFALIGTWGSGKTHLFKMLANNIKEDEKYDKTLFLLEFSPWRFSNHHNIGEELLQELAHSKSRELRNVFNELLHLFYQDNSNSLQKAMAFIINYILSDGIDPKAKLKDFLKDKHLIILLDDIDRLDKAEIKNVLKVIRSVLNFKNIHFGVGFDLDYMENTLYPKVTETKNKVNNDKKEIKDIEEFNDKKKKEQKDKAFKYLDKFFQLKLYLPPANDLKSFFTNKFNKEFPNLNDPKILIDIETDYENNMILKLLKTPRDVENVIYSSKQYYTGLENDTDLFFIIMLEILKLKKSDTYENLYQKKESILPNLHFPFGLSEELPRDFTLVFQKHSYTSRYPITDKKYFYNYFYYRKGEFQIGNVEFNDLLNIPEFEAKYLKMKNEIDNGKGRDLFQHVGWLMDDNKFIYNEHYITLFTKLYNVYQEDNYVPYYSLIDNISKLSNKDELYKYLLSSSKVNYTNNLYIIITGHENDPSDKIIQLFESLITNEGNNTNHHLYHLLTTFYSLINNTLKNSNLREILINRLHKYLGKKLKSHPWYCLFNFLQYVDQIKDDNDLNQNRYHIYSSIIPDLISFSEMEKILKENMISNFPLSSKVKKQLIEFLNILETDEYMRGMSIEFSFEDPEIFLLKKNKIHEGTITKEENKKDNKS